MKSFGQVLTEARKRAGLTQKEVAERLRREDGRPVDAPYLNAVEHDRRRPPTNFLIEQLAKIVGISADSHSIDGRITQRWPPRFECAGWSVC